MPMSVKIVEAASSCLSFIFFLFIMLLFFKLFFYWLKDFRNASFAEFCRFP